MALNEEITVARKLDRKGLLKAPHARARLQRLIVTADRITEELRKGLRIVSG